MLFTSEKFGKAKLLYIFNQKNSQKKVKTKHTLNST